MFPEKTGDQVTKPMSGCVEEKFCADGVLNSSMPDNDVSDALKIQPITQRITKEFGARRDKDTRKSIFQLLTTLVPFLALLGVMTMSLAYSYWVTLLLAVPTAGLLVRLFIFQHDCGHGSFFKSRSANHFLGRFISIFTLTPYDHWRRSHALHHATSGNLDNRGLGDVPTYTVREYLSFSGVEKLGYRVFRNPVFMIGIGVPINFVLLQRIPLGRNMRDGDALRSILGLNLMLLMAFGAPMALIGVMPVLAVYLPVITLAAAIGGWLFYVQHQFEDTYWSRKDDWNFHASAVSGSSYYDLPRILQWFTGNIGLHHIHHLCSRIPNHRLEECIDAFPELNSLAKRITLRDSLKCWRFSLWDEENGVMVGFRETKQRQLETPQT